MFVEAGKWSCLAPSAWQAEVLGSGIQQVWRAGFVGGADALPDRDDWDRASIRADVDAKRGRPP